MSTTVIRYSPHFGYGTSNPTSISLKQYIQNGATNVDAGMPQKTGYADNTSTFAQARRAFTKAPICSVYAYGNLQCNTGVVRVEGLEVPPYVGCNDIFNTKPYIQNGKAEFTKESEGAPTVLRMANVWSTSNHTIANRRRNNVGCGGSAPNTCLINGKQNNIMSSQELISRRKNRAIGQATRNTKDGLSFNDNNLNGTHTNYLAVSNARRRTRNGGYVVPPKCRGHGSGPSGPFGSLGNAGTGPNPPKGQVFSAPAPPKTACGDRGWAVTPLLGNNMLTRNAANNTQHILENSKVTGGIITATVPAKHSPKFF